MLSSTIIAALLAIGSALGSNGYGNTIDSRFDKLSDRRGWLSDRRDKINARQRSLYNQKPIGH